MNRFDLAPLPPASEKELRSESALLLTLKPTRNARAFVAYTADNTIAVHDLETLFCGSLRSFLV